MLADKIISPHAPLCSRSPHDSRNAQPLNVADRGFARAPRAFAAKGCTGRLWLQSSPLPRMARGRRPQRCMSQLHLDSTVRMPATFVPSASVVGTAPRTLSHHPPIRKAGCVLDGDRHITSRLYLTPGIVGIRRVTAAATATSVRSATLGSRLSGGRTPSVATRRAR